MMTEKFSELEQFENGTSTDKIIIIKSVYKTGKHTVQPAKNPSTGWYAGVERLSEEEKKSRSYYVSVGESGPNAHNTKLVLKDGLTFDLNNEIDAINWRWVRELPEVAHSLEAAQRSKALFYVHIDGRESEAANAKDELIFEAMRCVMEDPTTNYVNRALLLDMDMSNEPTAVIKEFLLDKAKKSPADIIRVYRSKSLQINLLYMQAKKSGAITVNKTDGVVKYGQTILGVSDESSIAFLQDNKDLLELLEREVRPEYFQRKQEVIKTGTNLTPLEKAQLARAKNVKSTEEEE